MAGSLSGGVVPSVLGNLHDNSATVRSRCGHNNIVGVYHRSDVNGAVTLGSLGEAGSREGKREEGCSCCHGCDCAFSVLRPTASIDLSSGDEM